MSMTSGLAEARKPPKPAPLSLRGFWHNKRSRALLYQVLVIGLVLAAGAYLFANAQAALARQGIQTGYGFLTLPAGFDIGDSMIAFSPSDSFLRAYGVAILNTLKISVVSIAVATILGLFFGIGRLSRNLLFRKLSTVYVEFFRNTPQLVQLIFWYTIITNLPRPRDSWTLGDSVFVSNRGLVMPWPSQWSGTVVILASLIAGLLLSALIRRICKKLPPALTATTSTLVLIAPAILAGWLGVDWSVPALKGFNFVGGMSVTPEFLALLLGLSLYIGAFLAEVVRSGIQSVGRGQIEAARTIGLRPAHIYSRVVLPQALRVMVPPAATQYVSILKNSSLGVAIGYPELFSVNNTIATLSGHAVEAMFIMMTIYLGISFLIAGLMNLYNRFVQIRER
jgi:general L-amino acid transport system permease protein